MTAEELPTEPLEHPLRLGIRLVGLAVLGWVLVRQAPRGTAGAHLASLLLTVALMLSWLAWVLASRRSHRGLLTAAVYGLSISGSALVGVTPLGMVGPALAGLAGGATFTRLRLAGLAVVGPLTALVSVAAAGRPLGYAEGAAAAAYAGLVGGVSRRQYAARARQAAELTAAQARADLERARADMLAERNRLARDLHDVLAHSLGALAVQLEALDAIADTVRAPDDLRAGLRKSRGLVTDGLAEARRAVQALHEEPVTLVDRLSAMAADAGARLEVSGPERPVPPAAELALVRAAQESLTNARKHAAGATVTVLLEFAADRVRLTVTNRGGGAATAIAETGSGLGLQGMRERVSLLGGEFRAGPSGGGWQVRVAVPA